MYFRDYNELEGHHRSGHYPCLHAECLIKKFVVFSSPQAGEGATTTFSAQLKFSSYGYLQQLNLSLSDPLKSASP